VRRDLGVPTVFNLLGPMANPAPVAAMLVGVADPRRMATMAAVLAARTRRAFVVHGHGGLDELSLGGPNRVLAATDGTVQPESVIDARSIGLPRAENEALRGGDPAHNAAVVRGVVSGEIRGPIRDVVVLNAAAALLAAGAVTNLVAGASLAVASLDSGTARAALDAFVAETTLHS
jgi:anthranilate phosphoribosyltransferase